MTSSGSPSGQAVHSGRHHSLSGVTAYIVAPRLRERLKSRLGAAPSLFTARNRGGACGISPTLTVIMPLVYCLGFGLLLDRVEDHPAPADLFQDLLGAGRPHKGLGVFVVGCQVSLYGSNEVGH